MSIGFGGNLLLQVLYAIGASFCLMVPLRRLGTVILLLLGFGLIFLTEALVQMSAMVGNGLLNMYRAGGLAVTYAATVAVLLLLYPICRRYGRFKQSHPRSLLRYL